MEEPKDQTVYFKKNEATVELTCLAEPPAGYELCYKWYCVGSTAILSDEHSAIITLERPSRNTEKEFYCQVSTRNEPKHHIKSKHAVVKLEIS